LKSVQLITDIGTHTVAALVLGLNNMVKAFKHLVSPVIDNPNELIGIVLGVLVSRKDEPAYISMSDLCCESTAGHTHVPNSYSVLDIPRVRPESLIASLKGSLNQRARTVLLRCLLLIASPWGLL
jgi:hypothetical protein